MVKCPSPGFQRSQVSFVHIVAMMAEVAKSFVRSWRITSKEDLAEFVHALRDDLEQHESEWESRTRGDYLDALEEMIKGLDALHKFYGAKVHE